MSTAPRVAEEDYAVRQSTPGAPINSPSRIREESTRAEQRRDSLLAASLRYVDLVVTRVIGRGATYRPLGRLASMAIAGRNQSRCGLQCRLY
eukprot:53600-Eustigmatos_ZCMA.PRE.1